jgi:hypothetical protein
MKTLKQVRREADVITADIADLQQKKRELRVLENDLRNKEQGLVPYETLVREIGRYGVTDGKPTGKTGQFLRYYAKYRQSDWVIVRQVKKNGEVGVREITFYDWEKIDE